jgi:hypothetical protein
MPSGIRTTGFTGSDEAFDKIQDWITECTTDHEFCNQRSDRQLPSRVIEVEVNDATIRLLETEGLAGQYVALNHCWGQKQIITTTRATLSSHQERISNFASAGVTDRGWESIEK